MRLTLQQGVYTAALGLLGGGGIALFPSQSWIGWSLLVAGCLLGVWGLRWDNRYIWQVAQGRAPASPILVDKRIRIDFDPVKNEQGSSNELSISIALCIWVTNGHRDGTPLNNLQARFSYMSEEYVVLPIRESGSGYTTIRHGEGVKIEVGRILWKLSEGNTPIPCGPRSPPQYQIYSQPEIGFNSAPHSIYRSLHIRDYKGVRRRGFAHQKEAGAGFYPLRIILSADGVLSKIVDFSTELFNDDPQKWIQIV